MCIPQDEGSGGAVQSLALDQIPVLMTGCPATSPATSPCYSQLPRSTVSLLKVCFVQVELCLRANILVLMCGLLQQVLHALGRYQLVGQIDS